MKIDFAARNREMGWMSAVLLSVLCFAGCAEGYDRTYPPEVWEAAIKACAPVGGVREMYAIRGSLEDRTWHVHANCKNDYISLTHIPAQKPQ